MFSSHFLQKLLSEPAGEMGADGPCSQFHHLHIMKPEHFLPQHLPPHPNPWQPTGLQRWGWLLVLVVLPIPHNSLSCLLGKERLLWGGWGGIVWFSLNVLYFLGWTKHFVEQNECCPKALIKHGGQQKQAEWRWCRNQKEGRPHSCMHYLQGLDANWLISHFLLSHASGGCW